MNLGFIKEIGKFGGGSLTKCFQCGACTAICPVGNQSGTFPRRVIRYVQLGLADKVRRSLDPWLCFYCGECSETCPRGADPGEAMMAIRRYQIAKNSWFKPAYNLSISPHWELVGAAIFAIVAAILIFFLHGPIVTTQVALTTFAPPQILERVDLTFAAIIAGGMLANIAMMYKTTREANPQAVKLTATSLAGRIRKAWRMVRDFIVIVPKELLAQSSYFRCGDRKRWFTHFILVLGYITMFVLTVILLPYYLMDGMLPPLIRAAAYFGAVTLTVGVAWSLVGRFRKNYPHHKHSHFTDWSFLVLLLIVAVTGIAVHLLKSLELALATYWTFSIHLIFAMTLLGIAPYMKWSHAFYRPFAAYFNKMNGGSGSREIPS